MKAHELHQYRKALNLNHSEFGDWLSFIVGRAEPFAPELVRHWETSSGSIPREIAAAIYKIELDRLRAELNEIF